MVFFVGILFIYVIHKKNNENNSNINLDDEFFQIKRVRDILNKNNLSFIKTIAGGRGKIGNALKMLNNLINICEKIGCKNIIVPKGLESLIRKPIFYKKYKINIFPNSYKNKIKIDINLGNSELYFFNYTKKRHEMRLSIIREEVLRNIPKCNINQNDLYIHIRSGDIFTDDIPNPNYSQPPLCFYQKIINENKYKNIFILSNGHENPVIDVLLKLYSNIKYIESFVENDICKIINAYNLVISFSTFVRYLIYLNNNLKNVYVYGMSKFHANTNIETVYTMKPSLKYIQIMKKKWNKTKIQMNLMLTENCTNNKLIPHIY